jgi:hypothetical protein
MDDTELQRVLREQLPTLTEPAAPPPQARPRVHGAVIRRRRRVRATAGAGLVAALVIVILVPMSVLGWSGSGDSDDPIDNGTGEWHRISHSPLSPREGSVSVWTGDEMIVVGGNVGPACPPNANCAGPDPGQLRADGAAYDPVTDTWRSIASAPVSFTYAQAAWTGEQMIVVDSWNSWNGRAGHTLAYDADTDTWRRLEPPPDDFLIGGEWDGQELVYWASEERADSSDWALDPKTGRWTELPPDPFDPTYDRAYVWTGDRFIFVGLDRNGDENKTFQVAEYDPATRAWRRLPDSPVGFGGVDWFFHQGYVVDPYEDPRFVSAHPSGGVYDPKTRGWSELPQSDRYIYDGCGLGPLGAAGDWIVAGAVLYSINPADTVVAPDCPELPEPAAGVWTGHEVIIWGGPASDHKTHTDVGLTWSPPPAGD